MRSAPKTGYDFPQKRQYRRDVWAQLRDRCVSQGYVLADSHVLLMPSLEGDEIDVAAAAGFRQQHMHVVDRNPAIVATLKRSYPRINTYGCDVSTAAARIAKKGIRIRAANLDLCSQVSMRLIRELQLFFRADVLDHYSAFVSLTILRGREHPDITEIMERVHAQLPLTASVDVTGSQALTQRDRARVALLMMFFGNGSWSTALRAGIYRSTAGTQTMLWFTGRVRRDLVGPRPPSVSDRLRAYAARLRGNHASTN